LLFLLDGTLVRGAQGPACWRHGGRCPQPNDPAHGVDVYGVRGEAADEAQEHECADGEYEQAATSEGVRDFGEEEEQGSGTQPMLLLIDFSCVLGKIWI
jgi:hypothetical protein